MRKFPIITHGREFNLNFLATIKELTLLIIISLSLYNCDKNKSDKIETEGRIAITIAEKEWLKTYGSNINDNKPFIAKKE
ncbi:hypothetical protein KRE40_11185 [Elizabethkingia meningoseptica]|uniref:hypothetical protein n=1 Tax=Elizabethkingia meningoseptica TaxID=238 RepID=UPI00099ABDA3|nr:hypothetical protein [Elizabethkingia meningoseptica]MDE5439233.1 hypothetical protein [Elizabethkingia meningoseptica]MDE5509208.1 hypothetical protein [Elizabethkingia meningoseptica]MDE5516639.1 hypothetical protein [Elizabethkingia meningoseptica]MDE5527574.1 hypothetical protein [Elizabethkingia meningoseptica]MDE5530878.1 hypothetical protein [Elizabethkingia meningoseptica]